VLLERCVSSQREVVELLAVVCIYTCLQYKIGGWLGAVVILWCVLLLSRTLRIGIIVYGLLINEQIKMCFLLGEQ
jgi:hypothetical protein